LTQTQVDLKVAVIELAALTGQNPGEALAAVIDAAVDDYLKQDARFQQLQTDMLKLEQDAARVREIAAEPTLTAELERFAGRRAAPQRRAARRRTADTGARPGRRAGQPNQVGSAQGRAGRARTAAASPDRAPPGDGQGAGTPRAGSGRGARRHRLAGKRVEE